MNTACARQQTFTSSECNTCSSLPFHGSNQLFGRRSSVTDPIFVEVLEILPAFEKSASHKIDIEDMIWEVTLPDIENGLGPLLNKQRTNLGAFVARPDLLEFNGLRCFYAWTVK